MLCSGQWQCNGNGQHASQQCHIEWYEYNLPALNDAEMQNRFAPSSNRRPTQTLSDGCLPQATMLANWLAY